MRRFAKRPGATARRQSPGGFTLVEQMLAGIILVVAVLGTLQYQYFAIGQGRLARAQMAATRAAQLLLEDWKSTGGSAEYDPSTLGLGFSAGSAAVTGFGAPDGLGETLNDATYAIRLGDFPVLILLKYQDVDHDTQAKTTLRQLAVVARFGEIDAHGVLEAESRLAGVPPMTFVTYVRLDASSG